MAAEDQVEVSIEISVDKDELNKLLVVKGLRIVGLTDVTVDREMLVKALVKYSNIPGNEVRAKAEKMLKFIVNESVDEEPASNT